MVSESTFRFIGLIVLIAVALDVTGIVDVGGTVQSLMGVEAPDEIEGTIAGFCQVEDVTVTLNAQDRYTESTGMTGSNYYRIYDGGVSSLKSVADAGTFTTSPGDELEIWMQLDANEGSHYVKSIGKQEVPCSGTLEITSLVEPQGNITIKVWNTDGDKTTTTTTVNQSISNGDVLSLDWEIQGEYETYFPGGVIIFSWLKSSIDKVVPSLGGSELVASTDILNQHTSRGTKYSERTFVIPELVSNAKVSGTLVVDADDTNATFVLNAMEEAAINWTVYDFDCARTDAGQVICGILEDPDDDSDVGDSNSFVSGFYMHPA